MEIELWRCEYPVPRSATDCKADASTLVGHIDNDGRFIRQADLCDKHVKQALAAGGAKIHDRRHAVPYHNRLREKQSFKPRFVDWRGAFPPVACCGGLFVRRKTAAPRCRA